MDQDNLQYFRKWFYDYVKDYYSTDTNIQKNIILKEKHTFRVVDHIIALANSLHLSQDDTNIAEVIRLFHDIGRFEQFSKYKTYRDGKSENHALLGLKVLEETGILEKLDPQNKEMIKKAVKYHNVCNLPVEEEQVILFSKLIRDADKLDSMDIIVQYFENRDNEVNEALEDYPDMPGYSLNLIDDIINNRNIKYSEIKNVNDMKLTFLAWFFDVNFIFTLKQMQKQQYLERIVAVLPKTPDIERVYIHLTEYLDDRISTAEGEKSET